MDLKVVEGSLDDLDGNSMAVADLWHMDVGSTQTVLMADGSTQTLKVAAVYEALRGEDVAYLPPRFADTALYARDGLARRAYITLDEGTDRQAATAAIREAVEGQRRHLHVPGRTGRLRGRIRPAPERGPAALPPR
ncbi:hypothetical protein LV779_13660 [Streptomyces thinghirensis]|nr:hypothetical protein [Streptomyces thinghirensis]